MNVTDKIIVELFPGKFFSLRKKKLISWMMGTKKLTPLIQEANEKRGVKWIEAVIDSLKIYCETHRDDYDNVPEKGAVIVIANHPTVMDGLAVIYALAKVRKDIKIVSNYALTVMFPQIKSITVGIRNMRSEVGYKQLKEMSDHLNQGGMLVIFPAGRLASITLSGLKESQWHEGFIRLATKNKAALIPVHITGANSFLYYLTATIWRPLSNLMVCREYARHYGKKLAVKICPQIQLPALKTHEDVADFAVQCREHLLLEGRGGAGILPVIPPIARAESATIISDAIGRCEVLQTFSDGKQLLLYRYQNEAYSPLLMELGRLREVSYRETGVGTGKKRDNDKFDLDYYHIIVWDMQSREIAGGYRLMPAGEQIEKKGVGGLYSNSLFNYKPEFTSQLMQTIEIGRGFIQKKYQKTKVLDYLWKGICLFITRRPEVKYSIGLVTIPKVFPPYTQQLIVNFYQLYFSSAELMFTSSNHYKVDDCLLQGVFSGDNFERDWKILNDYIKETGTELPFPYKQAAKWFNHGGSHLLGFVEDRSFNSIAGLNFCEIAKMKKSYYNRYLNVETENCKS